jgi:surface antigen Omp85-like protein
MVVLALWALLAIASPGSAADLSSTAVDPTIIGAPTIDPTDQVVNGASRGSQRDFTPLVAPIPFKNTQLGWGLLLVAGAIHRFDADTTLKPSTGGVGGFYTENKSWGVMAVEMARLGHDTWRVRGLVSHAEINYDFYGIGEGAGDAGVTLGINQEMDFAVGLALRRVTHGLYVGGALMWLQTTAKPRDAIPPGLPDLPDDFARNTLVAPGLQLELDTRDDDYWPTRGTILKAKTWFYASGLGSTRDFQRYSALWSWYTRIRGERLLLATNVYALGAAGDAPFYALPSIGFGEAGLRGYTQGRYRDRVSVTAQTELRYHTSGRFGAVVFGGFGQVAPDLGDLGQADVLPAGGLGLRYQLTRVYPLHMRFDYAWGKNEELFYFSIVEAF